MSSKYYSYLVILTLSFHIIRLSSICSRASLLDSLVILGMVYCAQDIYFQKQLWFSLPGLHSHDRRMMYHEIKYFIDNLFSGFLVHIQSIFFNLPPQSQSHSGSSRPCGSRNRRVGRRLPGFPWHRCRRGWRCVVSW